jgi:hypothetical protein
VNLTGTRPVTQADLDTLDHPIGTHPARKAARDWMAWLEIVCAGLMVAIWATAMIAIERVQ